MKRRYLLTMPIAGLLSPGEAGAEPKKHEAEKKDLDFIKEILKSAHVFAITSSDVFKSEEKQEASTDIEIEVKRPGVITSPFDKIDSWPSLSKACKSPWTFNVEDDDAPNIHYNYGVMITATINGEEKSLLIEGEKGDLPHVKVCRLKQIAYRAYVLDGLGYVASSDLLIPVFEELPTWFAKGLATQQTHFDWLYLKKEQ